MNRTGLRQFSCLSRAISNPRNSRLGSYVGIGGTILYLGINIPITENAEQNDAKVLETKIRERIARANHGHSSNLLPWNCSSREGRQIVKFQVIETSDLFFTLLASVLEMGESKRLEQASKAETKVIGSVSVWDSEISTGIEVNLSGIDDCRVRLSLPWAESSFPEVEITSAKSGFNDRQTNFIGRLIMNGNTSKVTSVSAGAVPNCSRHLAPTYHPSSTRSIFQHFPRSRAAATVFPTVRASSALRKRRRQQQ